MRATYVSKRAMKVCARRDRSLLVYVRPGIHPVLGTVKFAVSEMAIDSFNILIAAAITSGIPRMSASRACRRWHVRR